MSGLSPFLWIAVTRTFFHDEDAFSWLEIFYPYFCCGAIWRQKLPWGDWTQTYDSQIPARCFLYMCQSNPFTHLQSSTIFLLTLHSLEIHSVMANHIRRFILENSLCVKMKYGVKSSTLCKWTILELCYLDNLYIPFWWSHPAKNSLFERFIFQKESQKSTGFQKHFFYFIIPSMMEIHRKLSWLFLLWQDCA